MNNVLLCADSGFITINLQTFAPEL